MAKINLYIHFLLLFMFGLDISSATFERGNDYADGYSLQLKELRDELDVLTAWTCGTCLDMTSNGISRPPRMDAHTPKALAPYIFMAMYAMYYSLKTASFVKYRGDIPKEDRGRICGRYLRNTLKYAARKATEAEPRKAIFLQDVPHSTRVTFFAELLEDLKVNRDGRYSCTENDDDRWRLFGSGD